MTDLNVCGREICVRHDKDDGKHLRSEHWIEEAEVI